MRAHQQLPKDTIQVTRCETGQLLLLLGPLARLLFSKSARIAVKTMKFRRQNILATMKWPSPDTKNSLLELTFEGSDLFAGCFQSKLEEEVRRHGVVVKATFRRPRGPTSTRPARQEGKVTLPHARTKSFPQSRNRNRDGGKHRGPTRSTYTYRAWAQSRRDRNTNQHYQPPLQIDLRSPAPRGAHPTVYRLAGGGGRLQLFTAQWRDIGPDSWVLNVIQNGYQIEFSAVPPQGPTHKITQVPKNPAQRQALESEILTLLEKGAIKRTSGEEGPLIRSSFLLTPKKNGEWRPILKLKPLNSLYVRPKRFRMETLSIVLPSLSQACGLRVSI
ncbi:hypothetical protein HOLleu_07823 [Holothuria leucospilota]|uniref:Uncharacterized protein n=1 Tax=Holothuria leucospilota TaxID=206669 RepID=A0A9Q1HH95_HOLLE|nr:hypothetical protein HOLleu_07823 [Holothuria leucospilota]